MSRLVLVFAICATGNAETLSKCYPDENDFCWGTHGDTWCWLTNDGVKDFAKLNTGKMKDYKCEWFNGHDSAKYCEHDAAGAEKDFEEGKVDFEPKGDGVGAWIANWVLNQHGKVVGNGQCTELAVEAMKAAKQHGFNIPTPYHDFTFPVWSDGKVWHTKVQPGDIAQFSSWHEQHGFSSKSTWTHHTAVVVKPWDSANPGIVTYDQNPGPVKESIYHPASKTKGSVLIYRITDKNRLLRRFSDKHLPILEQAGVLSVWMGLSANAAVVGVAVLGFLAGIAAWRFRAQRRNAVSCATEEVALVEDGNTD